MPCNKSFQRIFSQLLNLTTALNHVPELPHPEIRLVRPDWRLRRGGGGGGPLLLAALLPARLVQVGRKIIHDLEYNSYSLAGNSSYKK